MGDYRPTILYNVPQYRLFWCFLIIRLRINILEETPWRWYVLLTVLYDQVLDADLSTRDNLGHVNTGNVNLRLLVKVTSARIFHYKVTINMFSFMCVCVLSSVWFSTIPRTIAHQAPLSMGFSRQEYWNGLLFPSPGDLPDPGIKSLSLALVGGFFTIAPLGKPFFFYGEILWDYKYPDPHQTFTH